MARPLAFRSLSSQSQRWKQTFLGALAKAGLKTSVANKLMHNRCLFEVWVGLLPEADSPFWQKLRSFADIRRAELALAAEMADKYRVEHITPLHELDLTVRTYNIYARAGLETVGDILGQFELPSNWREHNAAGVREELRDRLVAGGIPRGALPLWLTSPTP